jgi:hypothetical protein
MPIETPIPEKCPKCGSTRIAAIPVGSLVVGWFLLCAVFIVSLYYLKKGGI